MGTQADILLDHPGASAANFFVRATNPPPRSSWIVVTVAVALTCIALGSFEISELVLLRIRFDPCIRAQFRSRRTRSASITNSVLKLSRYQASVSGCLRAVLKAALSMGPNRFVAAWPTKPLYGISIGGIAYQPEHAGSLV